LKNIIINGSAVINEPIFSARKQMRLFLALALAPHSQAVEVGLFSLQRPSQL
jgi:hypothetical protein